MRHLHAADTPVTYRRPRVFPLDIGPWISAGVPGASLLNDNERYFCE